MECGLVNLCFEHDLECEESVMGGTFWTIWIFLYVIVHPSFIGCEKLWSEGPCHLEISHLWSLWENLTGIWEAGIQLSSPSPAFATEMCADLWTVSNYITIHLSVCSQSSLRSFMVLLESAGAKFEKNIHSHSTDTLAIWNAQIRFHGSPWTVENGNHKLLIYLHHYSQD